LAVVPNRLGCALTPDADVFSIKSPPADGVLHLTFWDAEGLLPMDISCIGRGSSDPYVSVRCGAYKFKSATKYSTLTPNFSFSISIPISEVANQRVEIELLDEDRFSTDDFFGKLNTPVDAMIGWGNGKCTKLRLMNEYGEKGSNGSIRVSAEWQPLLIEDGTPSGDMVEDKVAKKSSRQFDGGGLVFTGIYGASALPAMPAGTMYWVALQCTEQMDGFRTARLQETSRVEMVAPPDRLCSEARSAETRSGAIWDNGFEYLVERTSKAVISFDLMCKEPTGAPIILDKYQCEVSELFECRNCTSWRTVQMPASGVYLKLKLGVRRLASQP
jgi:Ca2+-dependent lipid-binding protein